MGIGPGPRCCRIGKAGTPHPGRGVPRVQNSTGARARLGRRLARRRDARRHAGSTQGPLGAVLPPSPAPAPFSPSPEPCAAPAQSEPSPRRRWPPMHLLTIDTEHEPGWVAASTSAPRRPAHRGCRPRQGAVPGRSVRRGTRRGAGTAAATRRGVPLRGSDDSPAWQSVLGCHWVTERAGTASRGCGSCRSASTRRRQLRRVFAWRRDDRGGVVVTPRAALLRSPWAVPLWQRRGSREPRGVAG